MPHILSHTTGSAQPSPFAATVNTSAQNLPTPTYALYPANTLRTAVTGQGPPDLAQWGLLHCRPAPSLTPHV